MARRITLPKLVLAASLVAGASYVASWDLAISPAAAMAWKGAGVGLLAVYAALRARDLDGWLITAVMALGALGDVLLEAFGLTVGAVAFLAGHLVAIWLYLRNRRPSLSLSQRLLAILLVPATVFVAYLLPADRAGAPGVAVYATVLALMAAAAWTSRFHRYRVGAGALMFVASDLLIFARSGALTHAPWIDLAVWGLYYLGQILLCIGVTGALAKPRDAPL